MVRPHKVKFVNFEPGVTYFKPRAVPMNELEEVDLAVEELEAMRLANLEKLSQEDGAARMKVHQSTFQRMLARAREKVTDALVNGKAIKIHGGTYTMGRGHGRPSMCACPSCGLELAHITGVPCRSRKCPKCRSIMARGG